MKMRVVASQNGVVIRRTQRLSIAGRDIRHRVLAAVMDQRRNRVRLRSPSLRVRRQHAVT